MMDNVQYNIVRKNRKTVSILIERDGTVSVYVPACLSDDEINELIKKKEYQIYKYLSKQQILNEKRIHREAVNGQSFLYLGRNYYLQFSDEVKKLMLKHGRFLMPTVKKDNIDEAFKEFYREKGKRHITERVEHFSEKMGLTYNGVTIMELKNRWASCSLKTLKLNFHWRIMMAPLSVIDYLVVHELAHLKFPQHNEGFWNEIDKILPNFQDQVNWLKQYGASMTV